VTARPLCLLLLALGAAPVWAEDANLGRLFFTPAERQALEAARKKNIRAEVQATAEQPPRPQIRNVTVSGLVRRSDGENTVWVNGKPVDGSTADGLKVRITAGQGAVIVHEPEKGRTVRLKVGQHADIVTGRVEESYERRQAVTPPAASPEPASAPAEQSPASPSRKGEDAADGPDEAAEDGAQPGEAGGDGRS
jgi:hypothetical protein